ncbi:hypothetical protein MCNS_37070 [Mycobacterium conspicuum]|uniref:Uncharacterized protein n=1 Tax=Mycobacterium conspicuum TaxID=44010 RepID=A0A7I7YHE8_9MYCO|nr:hypothetical protein MCNS_37070 [Mycobacterium conspicuum]
MEGAALGVCVLVVGRGDAELGPGIGGSGSTAVCVFIEPLAMISAMTNPTTSRTAAAAAIHSQRGDFGPSDGGGESRAVGVPSGGGWSYCQYGGNCWVGFGWLEVGAHCVGGAPYAGA